ncbi:MAG: bifunctional riboflavin kinase/FAD synthetase [Marinicellaceae bacterium]
MKFLRYPNRTPLEVQSVVTIGNFDGVHLGHQSLIRKVTGIAETKRLKSVVVTMQPLASLYFNKHAKLPILTTFKDKYKLIKNLNVDFLCVLNFNKSLAELSAEDFIQDILIDGLSARHIIIGDDFKFGKNRAGDIDLLKDYCMSKGIDVTAIDTISKNHQRVSSSQIRQELSINNFEKVKSLLGRTFSITGKITRGEQIGRTIDYPTINIKLKNRQIPLNGIFFVKVLFESGETHIGSASIGTRPTVGGIEKLLEVYILDFDKQVYGQNVEVLFYQKLRNELKFDSLIELKRHIKEDVIKTRLFFSNNK